MKNIWVRLKTDGTAFFGELQMMTLRRPWRANDGFRERIQVEHLCR
jgi:hypothetical protein